MVPEDQLIPVSALQHFVYCPRQCALIHVEGAWADNRLTAEGSLQHQKVHAGGAESRGALRVCRDVAIRSLELGLSGRADVVEFHLDDVDAPSERSVALPGAPGRWRPFPVEHKRGKPKPDRCDEVQLCAQALCLEEMLSVSIPAGALFYGKTRRRTDVSFDRTLRQLTAEAASAVHRLIETATLPAPRHGPKCRRCSLADLCMPKISGHRSARRYLKKMMEDTRQDTRDPSP